jgi:glycosyltransferase involved in cell wall biosynthesis
VPHVEHGFLPGDEYLALAAGMDAALCASLAESFGYAAAEFVELGVATVVSGAVPSVALGPLTAAEPSSVADVAERLTLAIESPALVDAQRASLRERAEQNAQLAHAALAQYTLAATRHA